MVRKNSAQSIPTQGRNMQGVRLMNVEDGERVVGVVYSWLLTALANSTFKIKNKEEEN